MRNPLPLLLILLTCAASHAQGPGAPTDEPETGRFEVAWPLPADDDFDRDYAALGRRHGLKIPADYPQRLRGRSQEKDAASAFLDPTYQLYVPASYEPGRPFGLFVWVSAGTGGEPPEHWLPLLDKYNLIWVGPDHIGNDKDTLWRTYLAIEAARQAKARFTIDDERAYVAGVSGGGRIASHAALVGADAFTGGGFYVVGCNFWRDTPAEPGKIYPGFWRKPDGVLLRLARRHRFVLLTGSADSNLANTRSVHGGYVKDKFPHATFLEVPGMGHAIPDAEWFGKGLAALEAPLPAPAELYEQAQALEKRKRPGDACLAYARASVRGAGETFAKAAAERAAALRGQYAEQLAQVGRVVEAGERDKARAAIATLRARWGAMAEADVTRLAARLGGARGKR